MNKGSSIRQEDFGMLNGTIIHIFTLCNSNGTEIKITNYGGIITSWIVKDKNGKSVNIVIGFDALDEYLRQSFYPGAIIGRYANLMANAKFEIDGKSYDLTANHNSHHLHGGDIGFDKRIWGVGILDDNAAELKLSYLSPDLEEGYPGNLLVTVRYLLSENDELLIEYECSTDKPTIVNLTNHTYFNLGGNFNTGILDHEILINADYYTPVNESKITTGEVLPVKGTPFDFTNQQKIGLNISATNGYNHNYILRTATPGSLKLAAILTEEVSGIELTTFTTEPGLQFYTGNSLPGNIKDRCGCTIEKYSGLCLETQKFPNSPNHKNFPTTVLRAGEIYRSCTKYSIGVIR